MILKDMISMLRTITYERVEIRNEDGYEILTCPTNSVAWKTYQNCKVVEWFPYGSPDKDATFTVYRLHQGKRGTE